MKNEDSKASVFHAINALCSLIIKMIELKTVTVLNQQSVVSGWCWQKMHSVLSQNRAG